MKLYYFDVAGRAEVTRIMLELGAVEYDDVRFGHDEWASKYKAMSPTGQAPFLELDDGTLICHSTAIAVYAAEMAGLWPEDAVLRAKTLEMITCLEDLTGDIGPTMALKDLDERTAARDKLMQPGGKMHTHFGVIDKLLASNRTRFYLSDEMGLADASVFVVASTLATGMMDGAQLGNAAVYQFENVKKLRDATASHPQMVARYKDAEGLLAPFKPDASG